MTPAQRLAHVLLIGEWSRFSLFHRVQAALGYTGMRGRPLVNALLREFPNPPHGREPELVEVILKKTRNLPHGPLRYLIEEAKFRKSGHAVPPLAGDAEVAAFLDLPIEWLAWFTDEKGIAGREKLGHYRQRWIPKSSGGARLIQAPKQRMKVLQRRVLHGLLDRVAVHAAAHGCVVGRSARTHAALHEGKRVVAQFDLADFFGTIHSTRVAGVFRMLGYPRATAYALASLCTTRTPGGRRSLPQGAPTSPALANLCAWRLDLRLAGLAQKLGFTYSRYVDDLAFSTDGSIQLATFGALVEATVRAEGFELNPKKTRVQRVGHQQHVTGLVVNEKAQAPRKDFDLLRARLHRAKDAAQPVASRPVLIGQIAWIAGESATRRARLMRAFDAIRFEG